MPNDIANATWTEVDADNTAPVPSGYPEGWFPSQVNNVGRQNAGAIKRFWDHINPTKTTAGSGAAYTLTYDVAPQSLWNGEIFSAIAHADSVAGGTMNINALGNKSLRKFNGDDWVLIADDEIVQGQQFAFYYNATALTYDIVYGLRAAEFSGGVLTTTTSMSGVAFNEAKGTDLASAPTVNIGAANGNYFHITGTTGISAFDTVQAGTERQTEFDAALILTHNSTSFILITGANITTAPGDVADWRSEGAGNWRMVDYQRANGTALVQSSFAPIINSLSGDVSLNNTGAYFDGPSVAQGSIGTWFASGTVTVQDVNTASINVKLWDGTTVIASAAVSMVATDSIRTISLSGFLATPAGNLRMSCNDQSTATGKILFNLSGNSKDSTITAFRVA